MLWVEVPGLPEKLPGPRETENSYKYSPLLAKSTLSKLLPFTEPGVLQRPVVFLQAHILLRAARI